MAKRTVSYLEVEPFDDIRDLVDRAAREDGDRTAYRFRRNGEVADVTFGQFRHHTLALGTGLALLGLDTLHVAMVGENSYRWITVYVAMLQSRGVFVPVDKDLPEKDLLRVLRHSDADVVFCSGKAEKTVLANRDKLPRVRYFVSLTAEEDEGNVLSYARLRERGEEALEAGNTDFAAAEKSVDDVRMLVYTSGTTGLAKGVMLTEKNLVACVYNGLRVSAVHGVGLSVLPYHHTYEAVAGLLTALHSRCTVCINENLTTVLKNLQAYRPDYVYLVPAFVESFYKKIMNAAEAEGKSSLLQFTAGATYLTRKMGIKKVPAALSQVLSMFGGNLRTIVCGGAPIRAELGRFFAALGIDLINGYGITECSPLVSVNQPDCGGFETAGYPLPCLEVRLADKDASGVGEICVKGDTVMRGFYRQPSATAQVMEDGWFHTGDYGRLNENGQLLITGRKKNLIVLENGKNIFPEEIEHCLCRIPYVQECVVFALRDENGAEVGLAAEVFLNAEQIAKRKITNPEAALRADAAKYTLLLPSYKHVSRFFIRPTEFEKTTTHKIRRSSCLFDPHAPQPETDAGESETEAASR